MLGRARVPANHFGCSKCLAQVYKHNKRRKWFKYFFFIPFGNVHTVGQIRFYCHYFSVTVIQHFSQIGAWTAAVCLCAFIRVSYVIMFLRFIACSDLLT